MTLLTFSDNFAHPGLDLLTRSAVKHDWDFSILSQPWLGFGTKLLSVYKHLKANPDIESFVFVDGHDVVLLGGPAEFVKHIPDRSRMLVSTEKGCWPREENRGKYPEYDSPWRFINSGAYYSPSSLFIELMESNMPQWATDDQLWLQEQYFDSPHKILLDYDCNCFQSYSFIEPDEFAYVEGRLFNTVTGGRAAVVHANGSGGWQEMQQLIDEI